MELRVIPLEFSVCKVQGVGISESKLKQIFQSFYPGSNESVVSGNGKGLAVKNIFVRFGFHINATSKVGSGTTFKVNF